MVLLQTWLWENLMEVFSQSRYHFRYVYVKLTKLIMEEMFLNFFYKATIALIPKPDKDTTKKRFINYSPSKDTKILNKMFAK